FREMRSFRKKKPHISVIRCAPGSLRAWLQIGILLLAGVINVHGLELRAAVAKADITPASGLPMYGFPDRMKENKLSAGTLDPLYARVLVLEAGKSRIALVTLDLGRTFGEPELAQLRQQVQRSAGISFLVVTASHTHSGPNILDHYPDSRAPA